ncbi:hypothetical protein FQN50_008478 [Emmonsiellopsis sp. PD_5]|nr:hypothetical protein FQN50_008478 [Emmonsiellopsis sp. PD_5]
MPFPSRGCRTCKRRRVKCDEGRPVCNRCQKSNLECENDEGTEKFIFLNENEFAVGRRKRPRGPNVNSSSQAHQPKNTSPKPTTPGETESASIPSVDSLIGGPPYIEPGRLILPALSIPLDEQALNYYARCFLELPHGSPEIADSHLKCVLDNWRYNDPQSILSLAVLAVSHATFGRARRSHAALAAAGGKYSRALLKTNLALKDVNQAAGDEVLLSIMLLSFYENSVMDKNESSTTNPTLQAVASRSFAHHDGAMAVLNLRRQHGQGISSRRELDKLVRRQLLRSLLLRSMDTPAWLQDGSQYGEHGFALGLDRCMVGVSNIRYRARHLFGASANPLILGCDGTLKLRSLLQDAQMLDDALLTWVENLATEDYYSSYTEQGNELLGIRGRICDNIVHIYPSMGHAGMWNRYRALRLVVNDIMLRTQSLLEQSLHFGPRGILVGATRTAIHYLADDICASVPYGLGLIVAGDSATPAPVIVDENPESLKLDLKAATASLLCWPLTMATMISGIQDRHRLYLKNCLLEVSKLVDDGVMERIAAVDLQK